jgi:uridine kinase
LVFEINPCYKASSAEGILTLHDPEMRNLYDLKVAFVQIVFVSQLIVVLQIFVQADSDLMLARRITRDTKERGRSVDGILEQYAFVNDLMSWLNVRRYLRYVKPSYDNFVLPSARHADIVRIWVLEMSCPTN